MPYPIFDRSQIKLKPLSERQHDMTLDDLLTLNDIPDYKNGDLDEVANRIVAARRAGKEVILMMGAHVIKRGLSRFIIDLLDRKIITHIGMNGAGAIHDFELALIGATTESVARYIRDGQFGLWKETGRINEAIQEARREDMGLGEAVGKMIEAEKFPHREISILSAGYRLHIPITIHVGIGYDIIHEHANCDGAATGAASYRDFLTLTHTVSRLQNGLLLNVGTAVMGPEIFLKALAMVRHVAHQKEERINRFTTAVFDLQALGSDVHSEAPRSRPEYYFRPYKTVLVRTVQDGGESFYIKADHQDSIPTLYRNVLEQSEKGQ